MRPRPTPGDIKIKEIKIPICGVCGFMLDSTRQLCSYGCDEDGDDHKNVINAIYKRTDEFLRDEVENNEQLCR